ncbi:MAG: phosphoribosylformylglycinamidine cyclo-ligase [Coriobacteriaceae bacterium]|nr:phosphoribosylformylglycinamidine cyclo-ligase [Coriobacteriaceae bacterium]MDY5808997.1 phosphoribosylformylglycinamidine cyclo-ligase [Coriobacteriales bacterium]
MDSAKQQFTYKDAGVDTTEGARAVDAIKACVATTKRPEVIGGLGGFGGLFSAAKLKDMVDPVLVSGTDGVGTKLRLAQLFDRHETVGIDLVAMCVNDLLASGAEPLFFLDYIAIGHIEAEHVAQIVGGIAEGCRQAGCALVGGEMAEHPGVMAKDDYDLAGFCVGAVDRPKMILPEMVQEGDAILGIASSGLHSNGYSLARRVLIDESADLSQYTAPQDRFGGESLVDAMLKPTRIYVKPILGLLEAGLPVHGVAHITGGGITENLNRVLPENLDAEVEWGTWDVPPVVQAAVEAANLSDTEAYRTFNMGVGMCVVCDPDAVDDIAESLTAAGETVFPVGRIVKGTGQVIYK